MTEIVHLQRKPMRTVGGTALAVKHPEAIHPKLGADALAWLRRERAALARRRQIEAMPDRITARLETEIKHVDSCILAVTAEYEAAVVNVN